MYKVAVDEDAISSIVVCNERMQNDDNDKIRELANKSFQHTAARSMFIHKASLSFLIG